VPTSVRRGGERASNAVVAGRLPGEGWQVAERDVDVAARSPARHLRAQEQLETARVADTVRHRIGSFHRTRRFHARSASSPGPPRSPDQPRRGPRSRSRSRCRGGPPSGHRAVARPAPGVPPEGGAVTLTLGRHGPGSGGRARRTRILPDIRLSGGTMGMNQRSLDLYQEELARRERALDRREAALQEREKRLEEREIGLRAEGRRRRSQLRQIPGLRRDLQLARTEARRLDQQLSSVGEQLRDLRREVVEPRIPIRSDRVIDEDNIWRRRWRSLEEVVFSSIREAGDQRTVEDSELLYVVVLGLLLSHGRDHAVRALRTGRTIEEIADPATGVAIHPRLDRTPGPLAGTTRSSWGGGFPRW
jgi:hypothetical protein